MNNKIITYSLLAHINNTGTLSQDYQKLFIPLVKRAMSKMCNNGLFEGDSTQDIKKYVDDIYGLEIPIAVLKKLLKIIEKEINEPGKESIKFYHDGSFQIKNYVFNEYEEIISKKENELTSLDKVFTEFAKNETSDEELSQISMFDFIERNKQSLGKYINTKYPIENHDETVYARFINFIRNIEGVYEIVQQIYIGSIISIYLIYEPQGINKNIELVLDTNFVISLLDLNTKDSTANCIKLLELGHKLGYKFTVLGITLQEIENLLKNRIENFDSSFLTMLVDPEDIYNACHRRSLTKTDLEWIKNNIESLLAKFSVVIVPNTDKYQKIAKHSNELESLSKVRNTSFAALHDATCIAYVKDKRTRAIYDFNKVNCWFVNNSSSRNTQVQINGQQPIMIKAEDLLNMLWLTSPMIKSNMDVKELANIGLTRLISSCLNDALPSSSVIKELDDNIKKYSVGEISDQDVVSISKSIAQRTLNNINELNQLAKNNEKEFVKRLLDIVESQKNKEQEQINSINNILNELGVNLRKVKIQEADLKKKTALAEQTVDTNSELAHQLKAARKENIIIKNQQIAKERESYKNKALDKWRKKSWVPLLTLVLVPIAILLIILVKNDFNTLAVSEFVNNCKSNPFIAYLIAIVYVAATSYFLVGLILKTINVSNVSKFEERIEYPYNLELEIENNEF